MLFVFPYYPHCFYIFNKLQYYVGISIWHVEISLKQIQLLLLQNGYNLISVHFFVRIRSNYYYYITNTLSI